MTDLLDTLYDEQTGGWRLPTAPERPTVKPKEDRLDKMVLPFINNKNAWDQYYDEDLYIIEKTFREWMAEMCTVKAWIQGNGTRRRYTQKMLVEILFERNYDTKIDSKLSTKYSKIFRHYSSRVQKAGIINGKHYAKPVYVLSPKRFKSIPPYGLRMRTEWLAENGKELTSKNMKLYKDLKDGHARNLKTEENMRRRREQGRKAANAYHSAWIKKDSAKRDTRGSEDSGRDADEAVS